mgnify:CR=1 FL=1
MRRATCASVRRCAALLLATTTALNPLQRWQYEQTQKTPVRYSGARDLASLSPVFWRWVADADQPSALACPELEPARAKAEQMGVKEIYIDDLREEFVRDYVFPMFRANAIYEGTYLLGTSIARPLIAKRQIEIAREVGADAVCHGATGKGNDQVRFELGYYGLKPDVKVIAPWREWDLNSRTKLISYAEEAGIPVAQSKKQDAPYSMDANLLHISYEGNALEDPWEEYSEDMFTRSVSPEDAPDEPTYLEIESVSYTHLTLPTILLV